MPIRRLDWRGTWLWAGLAEPNGDSDTRSELHKHVQPANWGNGPCCRWNSLSGICVSKWGQSEYRDQFNSIWYILLQWFRNNPPRCKLYHHSRRLWRTDCGYLVRTAVRAILPIRSVARQLLGAVVGRFLVLLVWRRRRVLYR